MSPGSRRTSLGRALAPLLFVCGVGCGDAADAPPGEAAPGASASGAAQTSTPDAAPRAKLPAPERAGGVMMRSADGKRLYVADEDNRVLRVLSLPLELPMSPDAEKASPSSSASASAGLSAGPSAGPSAKASAGASASAAPKAGPIDRRKQAIIEPAPPPPRANHREVAMPGAPANLLPLDGRVLVTVRDPGLLLVMKELPDGGLEEEARVEVAPDAWGLALTNDEATAVVTSAWSHRVTGVDLPSKKSKWSLDVAREPRGVVIHPTSNVAYVNHLVGGALTRIEDVTTEAPTSKAVTLPPAPALTPLGSQLSATLGYALTFDENAKRLLVARHAQGGLGHGRWSGAPTVDVLQVETDEPLLAPRTPDKTLAAPPRFYELRKETLESNQMDYLKARYRASENSGMLGVQPRAMVVSHKKGEVWIASEGDDLVQAMDLRSPAPAMAVRRTLRVGDKYTNDAKIIGGHFSTIPTHCGAPSGLAFDADETKLHVFCRSTYDVAVIDLEAEVKESPWWTDKSANVTIARLADDPLGAEGSRGRRLFYGAKDSYSSGGLGCAGCHPDGRDDGHIWHEVEGRNDTRFFLAHQNLAEKTKEGRLGRARQTPMLVGRVAASGPYGWQGQSKNLTERLAEGFMLHRWEPWEKVDAGHWMTGVRANALITFLRQGLVAPPVGQGALTAEQERGKALFESPKTECAQCHVPASGFTNRVAYKLELGGARPGFEEEKDGALFMTPSLKFVGGSPPYFHDGSVATLEALVQKNNDRMGKTNHLSAEDKRALVAYLETL